MAKPPLNIDAFPPFALKPLTLGLLEENARLVSENVSLREEIARLKGLKGKPDIKPPATPSGMDKATEKRSRRQEKRRRGPKTPSVPVEERVVAAPDIPPGSRFKGYEDFTVQDLKIEPLVVCFRRERWLTPDGRTMLAPLPEGISDHFGPEIKRFILAQYHQGQTTVPRLVEMLRMLGVDISKRQVVRILTEANAASAPRSATMPSPSSPPPRRRAGPISSACCAPATATMRSMTRLSPTCVAATWPARSSPG